ncbi:tape measure protein [Larkinella sp. VNQ87]|uniref:tape measure protein n=1 Tax=Larkinella sp. VNQ87 TaxID=3400921 RepID=UPI003BFED700
MFNYSFTFQIFDRVSPVLMRISQQYSGTVSLMDRLTTRFQSGFSRVAQTVEQLKRKMGFAKEGQSIDSLRQKLDALTKKRDLMVGTSEIRRANREIDLLERRMDRMQRLGRSSGSGGGGSGGLFSGLKGMLMGGALIAGIGQFAKAGMDREQTQMAFQQILKTPEATKQVFDQLNKFADKTPYTNEQVYGAGRSLLVAGLTKDQMMPKMNTLGNVAAGVQTDFGELVDIYGKSKQKGFADTSDIWQYTDRKIPILAALQKVTGKDNATILKMAEQRKITSDLIDKAFEAMGGKGGQYDGMLETLSNSAGGKLSTFLGTMSNKIAEWSATQNSKLGSLFDFGTQLITNLGPVEEAFGRLIDAFNPLWESFRGLLEMLGLVGKEGSAASLVIDVLAGTLNALAYVVSALTTPFGQILLALAGVFKVIMLVQTGLTILRTAGITSLMTAMKALWGVMLANPITAILIGITALAVGVKWAYDNLDWFRYGLIRVWEVGKSVFGSLGKAWDAFKKGDFRGVGKAFANGWNEGLENAEKAIAADKLARQLEAQQGKGKKKVSTPGLSANGTAPGAGVSPAKDLDKAAGVSATVGGSKSTTITINVNKLIEKSEIHVNHFKEGINELEETIQDAILRALNSANSVATP